MTARITVKTGTFGPPHDPYGWQETAIRNMGRSAVLRCDGLGRCRLELHDLDAGLVRRDEWFDDNGDMREIALARINRLKANLLAQRHVGQTFDEAEEEWDRMDHVDYYGYA